MPSFIPLDNDERIDWANNFKIKFPDIGAAHGFSPDEIAQAVAACETIIFAITLARRAKVFSKICTRYRKAMLQSKDGKRQIMPTFTMPDVPQTISPPNAIGYLQKIARRLKSKPNYSPGTGVNLQVVAAPRGARSLSEAVAGGKLKSLANSVVRIDWRKGKADGLIVQSKRGDEETWTEIGRDLFSPFIDTRPPLEAGKPEIRYYRMVYMLDDKPIGSYSPTYTAVTTP